MCGVFTEHCGKEKLELERLWLFVGKHDGKA